MNISLRIILSLVLVADLASSAESVFMPLSAQEYDRIGFYGGWINNIDQYPSSWKALRMGPVLIQTVITADKFSGVDETSGAHIDATTGNIVQSGKIVERQNFEGILTGIKYIKGSGSDIQDIKYHFTKYFDPPESNRYKEIDNVNWFAFSHSCLSIFIPNTSLKSGDSLYYDHMVAVPLSWIARAPDQIDEILAHPLPRRVSVDQIQADIQKGRLLVAAVAIEEGIDSFSVDDMVHLTMSQRNIDDNILGSWIEHVILKSMNNPRQFQRVLNACELQMRDSRFGNTMAVRYLYSSLITMESSEGIQRVLSKQLFDNASRLLINTISWKNPSAIIARDIAVRYSR